MVCDFLDLVDMISRVLVLDILFLLSGWFFCPFYWSLPLLLKNSLVSLEASIMPGIYGCTSWHWNAVLSWADHYAHAHHIKMFLCAFQELDLMTAQPHCPTLLTQTLKKGLHTLANTRSWTSTRGTSMGLIFLKMTIRWQSLWKEKRAHHVSPPSPSPRLLAVYTFYFETS